jgi:hypothetical protein
VNILLTKTRVHKGLTFYGRKIAHDDSNRIYYELFVAKTDLKLLEEVLGFEDALLFAQTVDYREPTLPLVLIRKLILRLTQGGEYKRRHDERLASLHRLCLEVLQDIFIETRRWDFTRQPDGYILHYVKPERPVLEPQVRTLRKDLHARLAQLDARFGPGKGATRERNKISKLLSGDRITE